MRRRILVVLLAMTVVTTALFFVPAVVWLRSVALQTQEVDLEIEAFEAVRVYERTGEVAPSVHHSIAVYDVTGHLLIGEGPAEPDAATLRAIAGAATVADSAGIVVVALPLADGGVLRAAEPDSRSGDRSTWAIIRLSLLAVAVVATSAVAAIVLSRRLNRPLVTLASSAAQLGAGDFSARAPATGLSELDQVADALNVSAQRVGDLVERERQLTADMAHQLRTPLAGIRLAVEAELDQPRDDSSEVLREILTALDRVEYASTNLITLHRDHTDHERVEVHERVIAAAERWHAHAARLHRSVDVHDLWPATVAVRAGAIDTALDVLLENALNHGKGTVSIWMRDGGIDAVVVKVADEGTFTGADDPFAAARPTGGTHGIGLPLARSILSAEHASVRLAVRQPTTFAIDLPLSD
jgi:signal transduction histidine kinase